MRLLLIEDDERLCESLAWQLERENIRTDVCHDGADGLEAMRSLTYDLVLLDRMLPVRTGTEVLSAARKEGIQTPVIFLTALGELQDKITGLDCGADDYIVKPFAFEELMARIRSIARRPVNLVLKTDLTTGDLNYDPQQHILSGPLGQCTLSKREGDLMEFFLKNVGNTLPRSTILTKVWGPYAEIEDGNLDNYIHFIRRRLKSTGSSVTLQTVRGIGYRLEQPYV